MAVSNEGGLALKPNARNGLRPNCRELALKPNSHKGLPWPRI